MRCWKELEGGIAYTFLLALSESSLLAVGRGNVVILSLVLLNFFRELVQLVIFEKI